MTNRPTKSADPVQISRFVQPRHISVESKSSRLMAVAVAASIFFLTWCCSMHGSNDTLQLGLEVGGVQVI